MWLENRAWSGRLELLRLLLNLPLLWLMQQQGLVSETATAWSLLAGYTATSLLALILLQRQWVAPLRA